MAQRTSYHHGDLRQALINAAVELMTTTDIKHLSLRQVARQAGVSHAAPYRHFADKNDLLAVVAEEGFRDFTTYLQQAVAAAPHSPRAQFLGSGVAYVRYALDHPTHYRLMFSEFPFDEERYATLAQVSAQSFEVIVQIIEGGQAVGEFRAGEARQMALCAWTQVHGLALLILAQRLDVQSEAAIADLTTCLGQMLLQGVAAPGPDGAQAEGAPATTAEATAAVTHPVFPCPSTPGV